MFHLHTQLEVVAGIDQQVLRSGEKDVVGSVDEEVAPRLSHHRTIDTRQEDIVQFVVDQHLRTVIHEDASFRVHQQLTRIAVARLHRYTFKTVFAGVSTHTVHRGHPQSSVPVAEQTLHVVVRQTDGVLRTEILMVLMTVVAVQPSERGYPQLSRRILLYILHTAVRQFLRHHQPMLLVLVTLLLSLCLPTSVQHQQARHRHNDRYDGFILSHSYTNLLQR